MRKYWYLGGFLGLWISMQREAFASCLLPESTAPLRILSGTSCLEGHFGLYSLGISETEGQRLAAEALSDGYASIYAFSWLSVHGKFYAKYSYQKRIVKDQVWQHTTEQAFVQLGHPLDHRVHGSFGVLPLPFGINHDLYGYQLRSRGHDFWGSSTRGFRLSLRVRDDLRLEAGGGNKKSAAKETINLDRVKSQEVAFRLTKLTDLLSGTKLIASYHANSVLGTRKLGLASLVYNEASLTSFEWVRITGDDALRFAQLFRFVHEQVVASWRWNLVYEDIRDDSYRLSIGGVRQFLDVWSVSSSVHYERLRRSHAQHQGYILLGLNYGISETFVPGGRRASSE